MAGTVITIAQQKGGAGKTTLAAHLAVALQALGRTVTLVDIDPQASLSHWHALRTSRGRTPELPIATVAGWRAAGEIDRQKRVAEIVVVDSPPHIKTEATTVIRSADLVVVPVQPSVLDLWATRATLELAKSERRPVLLVLNRMPARSALAGEMAAAAQELGVEIAATRLGNRTGFAAAVAAGRTIGETAPASIGAQELAALAREIDGRIRG